MKHFKLLLTLCICLVSLFSLSTTSSALEWGDINDDGVYSTEDAILTLRYSAELEAFDDAQKYAADIVHDGTVDTDDATEILRIASGISDVPTHLYTSWETVKEPTCTEEGITECICEICGDVFHGTLSITPHTLENGVCTVCGFTEQKPLVLYNGKSVCFGDTTATVKQNLGTPQDILSDTNLSDKSITLYVYCEDYTDLGIFTFTDDKLTQFYSNSFETSVFHNEETYSLKDASPALNELEVGAVMTVTQYIDTHSESGEYVYSYLATVGNSYTFADHTDRKTNQKLNFHLTNGLRALNGQSALIYCPDVAEVAYNHSLDMATRDYFDHYTPEGLNPGDRITAAGIEWYGYGENIAAGYTDAYQVADGWYNSLGHRNNLLSENHTHMGVGIARREDSSYLYYSTQNFYTYY